jgi:hypothetical protein
MEEVQNFAQHNSISQKETSVMSNDTSKTRKSSLSKFIFVLATAVAALVAIVPPAMAQLSSVDFDLTPNPKFLSCLGVAGGPTPTAHVHVQRGTLADVLTIAGNNIRPHLAFDMFTVQRSNLLANGNPNPNFTNFGLAWYQSDLRANSLGQFKATIKTILLDQIFGFDPDASLTPTNTFHVGFWFNDPNDANRNGCTFDTTKPTPFNGEHKAGPVAMISLPDNHSNLGPLCTNPNFNNNPPTCNP